MNIIFVAYPFFRKLYVGASDESDCSICTSLVLLLLYSTTVLVRCTLGLILGIKFLQRFGYVDSSICPAVYLQEVQCTYRSLFL